MVPKKTPAQLRKAKQEALTQQLLMVVRCCQFERIAPLVVQGAQLQLNYKSIQQITKGETLLHIVAGEKGRYEPAAVEKTILALIEVGVKCDVYNEDGYNALHVAVRSGNVAALRALLKAGADGNSLHRSCRYEGDTRGGLGRRMKGGTALHLAAEAENIEVIRVLLEAEVDVNALDGFGRIALHTAISARNPHSGKIICNPSILEYLLGCGLDPNARDGRSMTPLMYVGKEGGRSFEPTMVAKWVEVTQILLNAKADITLTITDQDQTTALYYLMESMDSSYAYPLFEVFMAANPPLHLPAQNKKTVLQCALNLPLKPGRSSKVALRLIETGAAIPPAGDPGWGYQLTDMHIAVLRDDVEEMKKLLSKLSSLDASFYNNPIGSPLHWAAWLNRAQIIQELLDKKANLRAEYDDYTPLQIACIQGWVEVVQVLLEQGANPNYNLRKIRYYPPGQNSSEIHYTNDSEAAPLPLALASGSKELINLLLEKGAQLSVLVLRWAIKYGHFEVAQWLLKKEILDLEATTDETKTEFNHLLDCIQYKQPEIFKLLIEAGVSYYLKSKARPYYHGGGTGIIPLHYAVLRGDKAFIEILFQDGADFNYPNSEGVLPIHIASQQGLTSIIEFLLIAGVPLNVQNNRGETPLDYAARSNQLDCFNFLIQQGATFATPVRPGFFPFQFNCSLVSISMFELLLNAGVSIDAQDGSRNTPLHWAAVQNKLEYFIFLIQRGAAVDIKNSNGKTPLEAAPEDFHAEFYSQGKYSEILGLRNNRQQKENLLIFSPDPAKNYPLHQENTIMKKPVSIKEQLAVEVPKAYLCPLTGQIMHAPVMAEDDYTYEEEAILLHFKTSSLSPTTGEELPSLKVRPNRHLRTPIQEFLQKYPEFLEEGQSHTIYFSEGLQQKILRAIETADVKEVLGCIKQDARLLTRNFHGGFLIEHVLRRQNLTLLMEILKVTPQAAWEALFQQQAFEQWLDQIINLPPSTAPKLAAELLSTFLEAAEVAQEFRYSAKSLMDMGFKNHSTAFLELGLSRLGGVNHPFDEQGNTALHHAVEQGDKVLVKILLELGAHYSVKNKIGQKPRDIAITRGYNDIINQLTDAKVVPTLKRLGIFEKFDQLQQLLQSQNQAVPEKEIKQGLVL